ncbi:hypothetical protein CH373_06140 [Leptospira perolatii]|uniref:Uncharacterized protein n=1 Tax=Leptospira perolatii TaxID=2023191 RepID=A0A2M9ZP91_9LEPT|nr:hypothetical protein [Leptospira perolatii]PJZ70847.1 hypothetical protein CH360_04870 [Leptospira perolatii]PJZ73743.1 hypothetical protein CH373_06140 [Leptospira perolatii]
MKKIAILLAAFIGCSAFQKKISAPVKTKVPEIFQTFAPEVQRFYISPAVDEQIQTRNGTIFTIPKDSIYLPFDYRAGDSIELEIKEYTNPVEFLSSGFSLGYIESNSFKQLDSAGMFDIKALYQNSELHLKNKISVKFRNLNPGKSYNLYKVVDNEWQYSGSNQQVAEYREKQEFLYRVFTGIDKFTLWNFDLPVDNSCINISLKSLKIDQQNPIFYSVFSTSNFRINFKWYPSNILNINVPINDTVNILFWSGKKIGIIKGIQTPTSPLGKDNYPTDENCLKKGDFDLDFVTEDVLKESNKRIQYLYST